MNDDVVIANTQFWLYVSDLEGELSIACDVLTEDAVVFRLQKPGVAVPENDSAESIVLTNGP